MECKKPSKPSFLVERKGVIKMKYTILMSCGHEDVVDLVGKNSDRERKIEYFKSYGLCKE